MSWAAVIAGGAALLGGVASSRGAKSAAGKSAAGSAAAIAEERRQYDTTRSDTAPYRAIGGQAINALGALYGFKPAAQPLSFDQWSAQNPAAAAPVEKKKKHGGIGGFLNSALNPLEHLKHTASGAKSLASGDIAGALDPGGFLISSPKSVPGADPRQVAYQQYLSGFDSTPGGGNGIDASSGMMIGPNGQITQGVAAGSGGAAPGGMDYSSFFASPDYNFRVQQGSQALERSAAARGGLVSGNTGAALTNYGQEAGAQEYGNFYNRLASLAGIGQSGVNTATQAGMNSANNIGGYQQDAADARASGISGSADAWGNALGQIGGIAYDRWGRPKQRVVGNA